MVDNINTQGSTATGSPAPAKPVPTTYSTIISNVDGPRFGEAEITHSRSGNFSPQITLSQGKEISVDRVRIVQRDTGAFAGKTVIQITGNQDSDLVAAKKYINDSTAGKVIAQTSTTHGGQPTLTLIVDGNLSDAQNHKILKGFLPQDASKPVVTKPVIAQPAPEPNLAENQKPITSAPEVPAAPKEPEIVRRTEAFERSLENTKLKRGDGKEVSGNVDIKEKVAQYNPDGSIKAQGEVRIEYGNLDRLQIAGLNDTLRNAEIKNVTPITKNGQQTGFIIKDGDLDHPAVKKAMEKMLSKSGHAEVLAHVSPDIRTLPEQNLNIQRGDNNSKVINTENLTAEQGAAIIKHAQNSGLEVRTGQHYGDAIIVKAPNKATQAHLNALNTFEADMRNPAARVAHNAAAVETTTNTPAPTPPAEPSQPRAHSMPDTGNSRMPGNNRLHRREFGFDGMPSYDYGARPAPRAPAPAPAQVATIAPAPQSQLSELGVTSRPAPNGGLKEFSVSHESLLNAGISSTQYTQALEAQGLFPRSEVVDGKTNIVFIGNEGTDLANVEKGLATIERAPTTPEAIKEHYEKLRTGNSAPALGPESSRIYVESEQGARNLGQKIYEQNPDLKHSHNVDDQGRAYVEVPANLTEQQARNIGQLGYEAGSNTQFNSNENGTFRVEAPATETSRIYVGDEQAAKDLGQKIYEQNPDIKHSHNVDDQGRAYVEVPANLTEQQARNIGQLGYEAGSNTLFNSNENGTFRAEGSAPAPAAETTTQTTSTTPATETHTATNETHSTAHSPTTAHTAGAARTLNGIDAAATVASLQILTDENATVIDKTLAGTGAVASLTESGTTMLQAANKYLPQAIEKAQTYIPKVATALESVAPKIAVAAEASAGWAKNAPVAGKYVIGALGTYEAYKAAEDAKDFEDGALKVGEAGGRFGVMIAANAYTVGLAGNASNKLIDGEIRHEKIMSELTSNATAMIKGDKEFDVTTLADSGKEIIGNKIGTTAEALMATTPGAAVAWVGNKIVGEGTSEGFSELRKVNDELKQQYLHTDVRTDIAATREPVQPPSPQDYQNLARVTSVSIDNNGINRGNEKLGENGIETRYDPKVWENALNTAQGEFQKRVDNESMFSGIFSKSIDKLSLESSKGAAREELTQYKEAYAKWESEHGQEYKQWRDDKPAMPSHLQDYVRPAMEKNPDIESYTQAGPEKNGQLEFKIKGQDEPVSLSVGEIRKLSEGASIADITQARTEKAEAEKAEIKPLEQPQQRVEPLAQNAPKPESELTPLEKAVAQAKNEGATNALPPLQDSGRATPNSSAEIARAAQQQSQQNAIA